MVLNYLFSWAQQYTGKDFIFWMTTHHTSSSISIFSIGYVLTGLALDSHFAVVVLTLGVCHGVGFSLTYAQAIGAVMKVEKKSGEAELEISGLCSGFQVTRAS